MKNRKKILFVGGEGYLGRNLKNIFSDFDCVSTSTTGKNNSLRLDYLDKSSYSILENQKFDYIFLTASTLNGLDTNKLSNELLEVNSLGFSNFLQFIKDNNLSSKLIYISSMTVYSEDAIIPVKEASVLDPISSYGLGKFLAESIFAFFCKTNNLNGVVFRIPGLYGTDRKGGYIYNTAKKLKKNEDVIIDASGLAFWETINIVDLSKYIYDFVKIYSWDTRFNIYNIGYGIEIDFVKVAVQMKSILKSNSKINIISNTITYKKFYLDNSLFNEIVSIENNYQKSLTEYLNSLDL